MTAEEAMERIGAILDGFYSGDENATSALMRIAQVRGGYEASK